MKTDPQEVPGKTRFARMQLAGEEFRAEVDRGDIRFTDRRKLLRREQQGVKQAQTAHEWAGGLQGLLDLKKSCSGLLGMS